VHGHEVKGTLLCRPPKGQSNGTIAAHVRAIDRGDCGNIQCTLTGFAPIWEWKEKHRAEPLLGKMKVRLKREIVDDGEPTFESSMGQVAALCRSRRVERSDFGRDDVAVSDTRNGLWSSQLERSTGP